MDIIGPLFCYLSRLCGARVCHSARCSEAMEVELRPRVLILTEVHTSRVARQVHHSLVWLAEEAVVVFMDEGLEEHNPVKTQHYLPLEDTGAKLLASICASRHSLENVDLEEWAKEPRIEVSRVYRWRVVLHTFETFRDQLAALQYETPEELRTQMEVLLADSLEFKVMGAAIPSGSAQFDAFLALMRRLVAMRAPLLEFFADGLRRWLQHLESVSPVARLFLQAIKPTRLIEEYDVSMANCLFRMRNFSMAHNIYMASLRHPTLRLVAKMGSQHATRPVTVQSYLRDMFALQCEVREIDDTFAVESFEQEMREDAELWRP